MADEDQNFWVDNLNLEKGISLYRKIKLLNPHTLLLRATNYSDITEADTYVVCSYNSLQQSLKYLVEKKCKYFEVIIENVPMKPFFCIKSLNNLNPEFMEDSSLIKKFLIIFNEFLSIYSDKKVQMTDSIILDLTDALYYHKHVVYNIKSKTDERCHQFKNSNEAKLLLHEFEVQLTNFVNEINANNISESKNNFFLKTNGNWNGEITCNQNSNEKKFLNKFSYRLCKNFVIKKFDGKDRNNISIVKNQLLINMKVYKEVMEVPLLFAVADETNIDVETKEPRYVNVCETSPTTLTEDSVWEEFYWKSLLTVSISLNKETKVYTDYVNNYADGVCFSNEGIATKKESGLKKTSGSRENGDLRKNKFSHERQSNKNSATFSLKTDTNTEAIIKRCPDNDGVLSKCFIVWIKESATVYTAKENDDEEI